MTKQEQDQAPAARLVENNQPHLTAQLLEANRKLYEMRRAYRQQKRPPLQQQGRAGR